MSNDFDFGMDDLEFSQPGSIAGKIVLYAMLGVFALASMITTFSFFFTYAPGLGSVVHPTMAGYVAGAMGVILFDLGGLGWTVLRSRNSDTTHQFVIATGAALLTIGLSLLTSALQVLLSTSLDVGLYDAAGQLTAFGQSIQIGGVIVMTLGFVVNFGAIAAYVNLSSGTTAAVQRSLLKGMANAGKFAIDEQRTRLVIGRTMKGVMAQLPSVANSAAAANTDEYLQRSFNRVGGSAPLDVIDVTPDEEPEEAAVATAQTDEHESNTHPAEPAANPTPIDHQLKHELAAAADMLRELRELRKQMNEKLVSVPAQETVKVHVNGHHDSANFTPPGREE